MFHVLYLYLCLCCFYSMEGLNDIWVKANEEVLMLKKIINMLMCMKSVM